MKTLLLSTTVAFLFLFVLSTPAHADGGLYGRVIQIGSGDMQVHVPSEGGKQKFVINDATEVSNKDGSTAIVGDIKIGYLIKITRGATPDDPVAKIKIVSTEPKKKNAEN